MLSPVTPTSTLPPLPPAGAPAWFDPLPGDDPCPLAGPDGPVADRPKTFWLGHREYDPEKLGYRHDELPGGFLYKTWLPGNHNTGHEFDDPYDKNAMVPGRVGRKLSPDERSALIEFLKSM